jgi:hypothetical protein
MLPTHRTAQCHHHQRPPLSRSLPHLAGPRPAMLVLPAQTCRFCQKKAWKLEGSTPPSRKTGTRESPPNGSALPMHRASRAPLCGLPSSPIRPPGGVWMQLVPRRVTARNPTPSSPLPRLFFTDAKPPQETRTMDAPGLGLGLGLAAAEPEKVWREAAGPGAAGCHTWEHMRHAGSPFAPATRTEKEERETRLHHHHGACPGWERTVSSYQGAQRNPIP